eukprot:3819995-Pleurochrysis_carterae.AAC.1
MRELAQEVARKAMMIVMGQFLSPALRLLNSLEEHTLMAFNNAYSCSARSFRMANCPARMSSSKFAPE